MISLNRDSISLNHSFFWWCIMIFSWLCCCFSEITSSDNITSDVFFLVLFFFSFPLHSWFCEWDHGNDFACSQQVLYIHYRFFLFVSWKFMCSFPKGLTIVILQRLQLIASDPLIQSSGWADVLSALSNFGGTFKGTVAPSSAKFKLHNLVPLSFYPIKFLILSLL